MLPELPDYIVCLARYALIKPIFKFLGYVPEPGSPRSFGEKLIQYRRLKGINQKKLASILDIDPSTFSRWEQGRGKPSKAMLKKLDAIWGRSLAIILETGSGI